MADKILKLLEELSLINGVSGDEDDVRNYIIQKIKNTNCEIEVDNLGNLIVNKKGKNRSKNKVMLAAHMDEVGFITRYIDNMGFISVYPVGGIVPSVVMGRQIRFKSGIIGVVGGKPIHLLNGDEKTAQPKIDELRVDIGARNKEEAESLIKLGEPVYFVSKFFEFGNGLIKGKALDDRLGCAVMLDMIISDNEPEYDLTFAFTVQEEIGTRGAGAAAYNVNPDIAIVLETTTACDIANVSGEKQVCVLSGGSVVSYMDRAASYDRELYKLCFETAAKNNLKCQTKTQIAGGNDSGAIHKAIGGIRTIAISAPCRYLHSPSCVLNKNDCDEMRILAEKMAEAAVVL